MTNTIKELFENLEKAKKNVLRLLENEGGLVDMHGLKYRAWVVENLREDIKKEL